MTTTIDTKVNSILFRCKGDMCFEFCSIRSVRSITKRKQAKGALELRHWRVKLQTKAQIARRQQQGAVNLR